MIQKNGSDNRDYRGKASKMASLSGVILATDPVINWPLPMGN